MPTAFQKVRQTPMAAQAARHWQFSRKCSVPNKSGQSFHFRGRRNSQVQALAGSQKSKSLPQALAGNTTVPLYSSSTLAPAELELRTATPCITKPGGQLSILCFSGGENCYTITAHYMSSMCTISFLGAVLIYRILAKLPLKQGIPA